MESFVRLAAEPIAAKFKRQIKYFRLMRELGGASEEWVRVELVALLKSVKGVTVKSSNRASDGKRDRADIVVEVAGAELKLEIKFLPKTRNYANGWQRFQANKGNKKDFAALERSNRHGVIYLYGYHEVDWLQTKAKLLDKYAVTCIHEYCLPLVKSEAIFVSYWGKSQKKRVRQRPG
jgi:hypothetical protein